MAFHTSLDHSSHEKEKVQEIFPQYLQDTAKNLISFLEDYYEYLNKSGNPSNEVGRIIRENDIDQTSEKYLDAIQSEIAKIIPASAVITDRNLLYKRIVQYYKIKGTPESITKFFEIFFGESANVYFPGDDLFKLSDTSNSFLSADKRIQDSKFWQDYSYQIQASIAVSKWKPSYERLVHPAGMVFFVLTVIDIFTESVWSRDESYIDRPGELDSWLFSLTPPIRRIENAYQAQHTPKFQPGWLETLQSQEVIAAYEFLYNPANFEYVAEIVAAIFSITLEESIDIVNKLYNGTSDNNPTLWNNPRTLSATGYLHLTFSELTESTTIKQRAESVIVVSGTEHYGGKAS